MTSFDKPWTVDITAPSIIPSLQQVPTEDVFRVAILGAESTGKTTLCQDLARHFNTQYSLEFMRPYLQQKWDLTQTACEWQDLMPIAEGQMAEENAKALQANRYLFCDTTLFELMIYAYWYYDKCPQPIETAAINHSYDLILLTEVDVPWEADDLRDAPHQRHQIRQAFKQALIANNRPFREIGGNREQRVKKVTNWLKQATQ